MSSNAKRPIHLDLQFCYSGFKVEELEYIDYSRTDEDPTDQFLDTFSGKPSTGATASEDDEDEMLMGSGYVSCMEFISREESFSYRCSTPNTARRHRGYFSQDVDLSGFNDLDSGIQTRNLSRNSMVCLFSENGTETATRSSIESLAGATNLNELSTKPSTRKRIEVSSDLYGQGHMDDLDLSIEEEMAQDASSSSVRTLKRRFSLKFRRHISTGLFGSYRPRPAYEQLSPPPENATEAIESPVMNKPPGPFNLLFKKFRNRHFI